MEPQSPYSITFNLVDIKKMTKEFGFYEACEKIAGDNLKLPFVIRSVAEAIINADEELKICNIQGSSK